MTFYFFDLETTGFRPDSDRILQFAGQRTDLNLKPIGRPDNILVKLSDDVLPQPEAALIHGLTPQKVNKEGISEAELCRYLINHVFMPDTIAVGFNNLRFDNNFIRFTLWRNFYDAYEWSWKNGSSTWDLLDVVRMTRALRPEGIEWPVGSDGKPSNKLELLAAANKLEHLSAHDALSDVEAAISLASLLREKQPKLFDYLLKHRGKEKIAPIVTSGKPFIYTSGRYPSEWLKTTVACMVAPHPEQGAALVYDLRIDPSEFKDKTPADLAARWLARGEDAPYFPFKIMRYNRCPAVVGDMRVLDESSLKRLGLHLEIINDHYEKLQKIEDLGERITGALEIINPPQQADLVLTAHEVDGALYKGFVNDSDKSKMRVIRAAEGSELTDLHLDFADDRLKLLLPIYKARNFPATLSPSEYQWWQQFKLHKLTAGGEQSQASVYFAKINELSASAGVSKQAKHLLQDLKDYGRSILPVATPADRS